MTRSEFAPRASSRPAIAEYALAAAGVTLVSVGARFTLPFHAYATVGLLYSLMLIGLSFRVARGPLILATAASAMAWDYLFIPPLYSLGITNLDDRLLFYLTIGLAAAASQLLSEVRRQARRERERRENATALLGLSEALGSAGTLADRLAAAVKVIDRRLGTRTSVWLADEDAAAPEPQPEGGVEGLRTIPLRHSGEPVGVLTCWVPPAARASEATTAWIEECAARIAAAVERDRLHAVEERERILEQAKSLQATLFDGVSHELNASLATLSGFLGSLSADHPPPAWKIEAMTGATRRLDRIMRDLIDRTRLESGILTPKLDWNALADLANAAIEETAEDLAGHSVSAAVPSTLPLLRADGPLVVHALRNLLVNAAVHTPPGTHVRVSAGVERWRNRLWLRVSDDGPGLPVGSGPRREPERGAAHASRPGGMGLGLGIARRLVSVHGGEMAAENGADGGAVFTLYFPCEPDDSVTDGD